jgi:hypothetical protein
MAGTATMMLQLGMQAEQQRTKHTRHVTCPLTTNCLDKICYNTAVGYQRNISNVPHCAGSNTTHTIQVHSSQLPVRQECHMCSCTPKQKPRIRWPASQWQASPSLVVAGKLC